jgi:hypothetical protein
MKKMKKDIASFKKLNAMQMNQINGGYWVAVTKPDGTVEQVWVGE